MGIDCGRSGLVVIDCDVNKATKEPDGLREFEKWAGSIPDTFTVRTVSGGTHFYFQARPELEVRNSAGKTRKDPYMRHVDVRGVGGFVVAPGAMGGEYVVENPNPPIPMAPWLAQAFHKEQPKPYTGSLDVKFGEGYGEAALKNEVEQLVISAIGGAGGRNHQLNIAAFNLGQLVPSGAITEERIKEVLTGTSLEIGLLSREIEKTIDSGLRRGIGSPRTPRK